MHWRSLFKTAYFLLNELEILRPDKNTLIVTTKTCRVQAARKRKGMADFPCISVGMVEFPVFARTIDSRIVISCLSCPPETLPGYTVLFLEIHA